VRYNKDKFDLRALYAQGRLSDAADLNAAFKLQTAERFYGYFVEAAYHVWQKGDQDFAPFIRYEKWDTQASMPTGTARGVGSNNDVVTVGANYWPHPQVVFKADYQKLDEDDGSKGDKRFNLGLGYMF
jgi:phosphate-selective porin